MSTFYVRNMIRGNYSRFSNSGGDNNGSSHNIRSQNSIKSDVRNISAHCGVASNLTSSATLPVSISSTVTMDEKSKNVGTEVSFCDYRSLPDIDVNLNPSSTAKSSSTVIIDYEKQINHFSIYGFEFYGSN